VLSFVTAITLFLGDWVAPGAKPKQTS
jgi:hypothetical protein